MTTKKLSQRQIEIYEMRGALKILDCLWLNSYYSMGKEASSRIEAEFKYFLGDDWAKNLHKVIQEKDGTVTPLKSLIELALE
jgi:hypothetical protein